MKLFDWKDEYSDKIKNIDSQHLKFNLINELHSAMKEAKGKQVVGKIINKLVSYTKFHFTAEEKIMKDNNYPGYYRHKVEHDKLNNKVLEFQENYNAGKAPLSLEVMQFLKDWLVNHILKVDKEYSPYLNKNGIS